MWKKCVRWTKSVLAASIVALAAVQIIDTTATAQSGSPSDLPRLSSSDIQYVGAFRLPGGMNNGDSFSLGGNQIAFNPAGPSLFVGSRANRVAEVSIPSPVYSTNPEALPFATFLQPLSDPMEGRLSEIAADGLALDGLLVHGNRLYGTVSIYYDANNTQRRSHFSRSLQLNEPSFKGWSGVWQDNRTGFVSGFMASVPSQWQALLGGPAITGQCCVPIATRTSWGPAAFAFDPARIGEPVVPAVPLLYYDGAHPTLGPWDASNPNYGASTTMGGVVIIPNTRTVLYFGANGVGPNCYGNTTNDPALHGTKAADGTTLCYDPTNTDKGTHAYPYRYQMWAYDLNDFAAVRAGTKQPWEVLPYGVWPFDLPTPERSVRLGGVGYDANTQTLYLSQMLADKDGYSYRAIIHALHVNLAQPIAPAAADAVTIAASVAAPQPTGTSVRFSASVIGGTGPYEYRWSISDSVVSAASSVWTTSNEHVWTPAVANAGYRVTVGVRSAGSIADAAEATSSMDFPITANRVASVTLAANKTAPQASGTTISWTASPVGGEAPHQYKWWIYDGATWTANGDWTPANVFNWTPAFANANYRIAVWVRGAGNSSDHDAGTEAYFPITAPTGARVSAVTLAPSLASPQSVNSTITWTATASGGAAPLQYQWWTYNGANWTSQPWTASNTFIWVPTVASANYRVAVWVRSAGNTGGQEAATEAWYSITAAATAPAPAPAPAPMPTAKVTSVTLGSSRPSPQPANTSITWTAAATGGVAPLQYQWWVYDGAAWTSQPWTAANTFTWTPATAGSSYRVAVWVRSAGNSGGHEAAAESWFTITAPLASATTTAVALTANRVTPQPRNTSITWTAAPVGGAAPHQYQWWVFDGANWISQPWTTSNTFVWTPTAPNDAYRVAVWVKSAGNAGGHEASTEAWFAIK
jgi:hypothetical protein